MPIGRTLSRRGIRPAPVSVMGGGLIGVDVHFTGGNMAAGVTMQRAAMLSGSWSTRGATGALLKGAAANVARFDYDPPVENLIRSSADHTDFIAYQAGDASISYVNAVETQINVSAVGPNDVALTYVNGTASGQQTFAIDLKGVVGGEVVYVFWGDNSGINGFRRVILTTSFQRVSATGNNSRWHIGNHNQTEGRNAGMAENVPAQSWIVRRRQLNRGPVALDYTETTGVAVYVAARCRGVMFEPERTNYISQSEALTTRPWDRANENTNVPIISADVLTAPDGTVTADNVSEPAVPYPGFSVIYQETPPLTGGYVASSFVRAISLDSAPGYAMITPNGSTYARAAIASAAWSRVSFAFSASARPWFFQFGTDTRDGQQSVKNASVYSAWGAQVEAGIVASSYIGTTTDPVIRPAEFLTFDVSGGGASGAVLLTYADGTTETRAGTIIGGVLSLPASSTPRVLAVARVLAGM